MATDLSTDDIYLKSIYYNPENSASYSSVSKFIKKQLKMGGIYRKIKLKNG